MIHYLTTSSHRSGIERFLVSRGKAMASFVQPVAYGKIFSATKVPPGTYVFTDLDRLGVLGARRVETIWRVLEESGRDVRLLNHPIRARLRYELLRTLYESGANAFNLYRATEAREPERYPVFLRGEHDHKGPRSELIPDRAALGEAIERTEALGWSRESILIEEFYDTADAHGIYRKYSSFYVGGCVVPRHLFFKKTWMVKAPDLAEPELLDEEWRYLQENPHEKRVREVFELARLDYGRIDYTMHDGRMQVWEINTNPYVTTPEDGGGRARHRVAEHFMEVFADAMRAVDRPDDRGGPIRIMSERRKQQTEDPEEFVGRWNRLLHPSRWPWRERRRRHRDVDVRPESSL